MSGYDTLTVTIAKDTALSGAFDTRQVTEIWLVTPAAWTAAVLGFKVCPTAGGTFAPLSDAAGALIGETLVTGGQQPVPAGVVGAGFVKLWSHDGAGANVNQAAARTFTVILRAG
jgi:hypothetical protein